ncbi:hypothetical protein AB835_00250 [Candidatus Endobugula sertula]|uniref:BryC n=1 Tax=Candidatus Endobugula sertula TaxID=62101 RepID=A0MS26_9GAMM|nr:BryC [Candidatus Endobugula sertula]ODS25133.1 hypothetical protein AB835_00250 [Candidatus Endobugula sertula]
MKAKAIFQGLKSNEISIEQAEKMLLSLDTESKHGHPESKLSDIKSDLHDDYALVLLGGHLFEELRLSEWKVANPNPNEVSIQVKASAISFTDTLCVQGLYPSHYPFVPGFEVSGVIRQVGEHITDLHVGDEVIAFTGSSMGGHAAYVTVPQDYVVRKPKDLSFEDACSFPLAFATVYHSFARGKLSHNDHILIQTATGGCGLMALQLARLKQCVCYGTSSREDKLALLKQWALPYVFNYKTCNIDEEIQRVSGHQGVDVVLNMLPGEHIQQGLNSLAKGGRYLELSMHGLLTNEPVSLSSLRFNQSVQTINLLGLLNKGDDGFIGSVLAQMVSWIESGDLVSTVSRIYPLDQIGEALRYVSAGEHIGKVVVSHTATEPMDCRQRCIDNVLKQGQMAALTATGGKSRVWGGTGVNDKPSPAVGIEERLLEGIAVIGLSGQYPKSKTLEQFWQTLADGVDCISEIPADRWSLEEYYSPIPEGGKTYCKWMGVLEDMDCFDPLFFAISPREAEVMDPQQRLFLENAWSCIEDAGINPKMLSRSRCGVFVGSITSDYKDLVDDNSLGGEGMSVGTGSSPSILSARISYFLNLKGPCLAIDTACSSSLVAIAESCNSLVLGTSDLALAGGVLLMPGPSLHIGLSHGEMLSVDGRCFTFDQRANGFVPGEGVGVVLLKRMSDAVRDGDPIRAVIRGWGVNQDGRSNGITAPSSKAQSALEQEVYQRFNIDPSSITLVEAHGTGTKLGDPIEVEALTESFRVYTDKRHYCALGSVKSNIGHLGVGAGIAGVTKVLLSLQHRMLPPTIHCEDVNPQIALEGSPFYINTELKPWQSGDGIPRRACVSSFGVSGTNAHLVLEEYTHRVTSPLQNTILPQNGLFIVPLSAKNDECLNACVERLLFFLKSRQSDTYILLDLAYTLQVSREAMTKRVAFVVKTTIELMEKLNAFIEKRNTIKASNIKGCYYSSTKTSSPLDNESTDHSPELWINKGSYDKLANAWCQGLYFDWNKLYNNAIKPRRIHLPTYAFARDRCWLPEKILRKRKNKNSSNTVEKLSPISTLHPLLHKNTSDWYGQKFTSIFNGEEFFLRDHVVQGKKILPGVTYLEMTRAAVQQSIGLCEDKKISIQLNNVIWKSPIEIGFNQQEVNIRFYRDKQIPIRESIDEQITYEIYTGPADPSDLKTSVRCQGVATFSFCDKYSAINIEKSLDIPHLKSQLSQESLDIKQCYEHFKQTGMYYGLSHQAIDALYIGDYQVLAKLSLPECVKDTQTQFVLHPSLMDSALQASIGLSTVIDINETDQPTPTFTSALPFALENIDIIKECTASMWAWVRNSKVYIDTSKIRKLDIDLCDEQGNISVSMKGLSCRIFNENAQPSEYSSTVVKDKESRLEHPLIHIIKNENKYPVEKAHYISCFTGNELFLLDHGHVLPGVIYLEMICAAAKIFTNQDVIIIKNIVWNKPIKIESDREVSIYLNKSNDCYEYQITTLNSVQGDVLHSQGKVLVGSRSNIKTPSDLKIEDIQSRCTVSIEAEKCDELISRNDQGPSILSIENLCHNDCQMLARLKIPSSFEKENKQYLLCPSLMHGAVLSTVALSLIQEGKKRGVLFPYSMKSMHIYAELSEVDYAYVRKSKVEHAKKYDIDLISAEGKVIVSIKELTLLSLKNKLEKNVIHASVKWQEHPLPDKKIDASIYSPIVILADKDPNLKVLLNQIWPNTHIKTLLPFDENNYQSIEENFIYIIGELKNIFKNKLNKKQSFFILIKENNESYRHSAFAGLLATANEENTKFRGKVIHYPCNGDSQWNSYFVNSLQREALSFDSHSEVRYSISGTREVKTVFEVDLKPNNKDMKYLKQGDVVWITGGMGSLGQIFAKEFVRMGITVILSGRSEMSEENCNILEDIKDQGTEVVYKKCDVCNKESVKNLLSYISEKYNRLNGIIHAAGIIHDATLKKSDEQKIRKVLEVKISGILAIEEASENIDLDFMVLFSSLAAFGNPGQASYAGANAFLDGFTEYRQQLYEQGKCLTKTFCLNWPLWKEGGMSVDEHSETLMRHNSGMVPMDTQVGLDTLKWTLSGEYSQILSAQGNLEKIREILFSPLPIIDDVANEKKKKVELGGKVKSDVDLGVIKQKITEVISNLQKINIEKIECDIELSEYGFDSVSFTEFANILNKEYRLELMPTLFFEHPTIASISHFLLEKYPDNFLEQAKPPENIYDLDSIKPLKEKSTPDTFFDDIKRIPTTPLSISSTDEKANDRNSKENEPIAVIGMSGRFPKSADLNELWEHLHCNRDLVSEVPDDRWDWRDFYGDPQQESGKTKVKCGGFMDDIDCFDPLFFGISPIEAESMDPQLRVLLETVWACIEDAGYRASYLSGSQTAVFVGVSAEDYKELCHKTEWEKGIRVSSMLFHSAIPNRISYILNLHGPSEPIDTACSSSLVAIHRAIESIRQGSAEMALVAGVNIIASPSLTISGDQSGMLSEDGRCKTFDETANGYGRGEGVGVVFLKPLSKALADKDQIHGLIIGSAENHGGKATSPTAPNPLAQQALLKAAYQKSNLDHRTVTYIEAHGTGTELGDPIEINALKSTFADLDKSCGYADFKKDHCALGSIKSNIGHLESAAGISGILKVLLMMKHKKIPGNVHLNNQNPYLQLQDSPFYLSKDTHDWKSVLDEYQNPIPRRAGVNSFGIGGSNAHIILEEYHTEDIVRDDVYAKENTLAIIPLSAKKSQYLYKIASRLLRFIQINTLYPCDLFDLAYTCQVGREVMDKRLVFVVKSIQELEDKLKKFIAYSDANSQNKEQQRGFDFYQTAENSNSDHLTFLWDDEDTVTLLSQWVNKGKYHKLAEAWSQGLDIDWMLLYTHSTPPRRISLPTYPFARDRYWLPEKPRYNAANHPVSNHQTTTQNHSRFAIDTDHDVIAEIMQKTNQQELEQWLLKLLFVQLQHMGLFQHRVFETATALRQSAGIVDKYDRWWHECLSVLQDAGYLEWKDDSVAVAQALESESQEAWWSRWNTEYKHYQNDPEKKTLAILINDCLQALPEVLSGEQLITDIIFPNGSMEKMEGLYKNNRIADYCNQCVGDLLVQFIEARLSRDANARIRIIEIGAGTGGTTAIVLPMLQAYQDHIDTYCYTDVSKAFLMHGQEHYGEQYPYLSYRLCNIEQDLVAQGITAGDYDIAIAANVLHATRNIHETVSHVRQALAANGLLILNEFSQKSVFSSVIFGLIDGWALSEDTGLRIPGSPGLYPKQWQAVLEASGFGDVEFPLHDARELGQQIILATNAHANVASDLATSVIDHAPKRLPSAEVRVERDDHVIDEGVSHDAMMKASVKQLLVEQLSQSLKLDMNEIHPDASFADYGVDSITGASFIQQLNDTLTLTLKTVCLFDHSSVNRLTAYLLSDYGDDIAQWLATAPALVDHPQSVVSQVLPERSPASTQAKPLPSVPPSLSMESPVQQESIAIIGMSGRFAASENLEAFWQQLAQGVDLVEPASRWGPQAETYYGSFLKDMDQFDPLFFNLSGVEASYMDPQQRCFLEESWNALENAGYVGDGIEGKRCGIYAGCVSGDYAQLFGDQPPPQAFWGNASSIIPARIAYYLNLQGPATAVDTACSSSLVAVHLACQALHLDEMEMALAGGVSLYPTPSLYESLRGADMLSSRGRCHSFDACADGIVIGEGVGVVVLKRLSAALADGDHIHGVIRGSGINQDGRSNGITAPSAQSQERLERWVYDRFDVNPEHIQMVEAHGTGTVLGDPIECEALTRAFRHYTDKEQYCAIGSVKTNMGHGTMVAGMAGLFKVVLSMQHRQIPPSLHFTQGNPNIDFDRSPFYVNTELRDWSVGEGETRCATVSAFGFSGTNAHAVIEEAPPVVRQHEEQPGYLVVLSAHSDDQLRQQVENLWGYCEHHPELDVGNLSYTLLLGRQHWSHRLACVACDLEDLRRSLDQWLGQGKAPRVYVSALAEGEPRLQVSLQHFGNDCIRACSESCSVHHYVDALSTVGDLYVQGYPLEYGALFAQGYGRIPLPTYPFARQRCWVIEKEVASKRDQQTVSTQAVHREPPVKLTHEPTTLLCQPVWHLQEAPDEARLEDSNTDRLIILCEMNTADLQINTIKNIPVVHLHSTESQVSTHYCDIAAQAFATIKALLKQKTNTQTLIQILVYTQEKQQMLGGLLSLLKTAQIENPKISGQLIELDREVTLEALIKILEVNRNTQIVSRIRYEAGQRKIEKWKEVTEINTLKKVPWKNGGIYLMSGGAGGIALSCAKVMAQQIREPVLILTGRSALTESKRTYLKELTSLGAKVLYRQMDVSKSNEVESLVKHVVKEYGRLNGILHMAGIIQDNFILMKTVEEFKSTLSPKVTGTVNLDQATKNINLDFFILFSSISSVYGNMGQSDYATANAFMDEFSEYRNTLVSYKERSGKTVSINWPYWQEGGMRLSLDRENQLKNDVGLVALTTEHAIAALHQSLSLPASQVLIMFGYREKIRQSFWNENPQENQATDDTVNPQLNNISLQDQVLQKFKELLSEHIQVPAERLGSQQKFESFGIDSLIINQLNKDLSLVFGEISKTLFYEYRTLIELVDYLIAEYPEQSKHWLGQPQESPSSDQLLSLELSGKTQQKTTEDVNIVHPIKKSEQEAMAVIGMSACYPSAKNLDQYWENLKCGKNCITEIPDDRWSIDEFFCPDVEEALSQGKSYSKWGGFLEDFAAFDPLFFNLSPRDAMRIDPQERIFLQECWRAFEDAGYVCSRLSPELRHKTGVYGAMTKINPNTSFASLVNRVSYIMDLHGPSVPVDSMCSSALVALHQACESLRQGTIDMALVGAVNLYLHQDIYLGMCQAKVISDSATPAVFGCDGKGFTPSEGVGAVVIKRLSDAEKDNDRVLAVIRGSAVNHSGRTNHYGVPCPRQQAAVIHEAIDNANVDPRSIAYIESAANGSEMGDAIEMSALTKVFQTHRDNGKAQYSIGSLKSILGHGEAVSGMAQFMKVVLQLRNKTLCPTPDPQQKNPNIHFENLPFELQTELDEWRQLTIADKKIPRRAGITALGAGGVNAHMIVEEYQEAVTSMPKLKAAVSPIVFVLSAKTQPVFNDYLNIWVDYLNNNTDIHLNNLAYSLQCGREAMKYRFACVIDSHKVLLQSLHAAVKNSDSPNSYRGIVNQLDHSFINVDENKQVEQGLIENDLTQLAKLWVAGRDIEWQRLYKDSSIVHLTQLPTYPFSQKVYWENYARKKMTDHIVNGGCTMVSDIDDELIESTQSLNTDATSFIPLDLNFIEEKNETDIYHIESYDDSYDDLKDNDSNMSEMSDDIRLITDEVDGIEHDDDIAISQRIRTILDKLLYLDDDDEIDEITNFVDIGITSMNLVEFISQLNREFSLDMKETVLFDYPNINTLSNMIENELEAVEV